VSNLSVLSDHVSASGTRPFPIARAGIAPAPHVSMLKSADADVSAVQYRLPSLPRYLTRRNELGGWWQQQGDRKGGDGNSVLPPGRKATAGDNPSSFSCNLSPPPDVFGCSAKVVCSRRCRCAASLPLKKVYMVVRVSSIGIETKGKTQRPFEEQQFSQQRSLIHRDRNALYTIIIAMRPDRFSSCPACTVSDECHSQRSDASWVFSSASFPV
jgi:hypothetical protein